VASHDLASVAQQNFPASPSFSDEVAETGQRKQAPPRSLPLTDLNATIGGTNPVAIYSYSPV
jgi:hypothetical protein